MAGEVGAESQERSLEDRKREVMNTLNQAMADNNKRGERVMRYGNKIDGILYDRPLEGRFVVDSTWMGWVGRDDDDQLNSLERDSRQGRIDIRVFEGEKPQYALSYKRTASTERGGRVRKFFKRHLQGRIDTSEEELTGEKLGMKEKTPLPDEILIDLWEKWLPKVKNLMEYRKKHPEQKAA